MKTKIKKILGENNIRRIKWILFFCTNISLVFNKNRIVSNSKFIKNIKIYSQKNKNIFCGYYDLEPIQNDKLLVHVCNKKNMTNSDKVEIGYYDINSGEYHKVSTTAAWCWQQGSRLRWSNKEEDVFFYNDVYNNDYCCIKYNLKQNKVEKIINSPLYDIDKTEKYGISINFGRLQRLRPGYGYNSLLEMGIEDNASKNDGLFVIDMETNKKELLISLYDLAINVDPELKYEHYLNHISFSPNGKKVMFFHLWTEKNKFDWNNELCVIDITGDNLVVIEKNDLISHYDWKSNEELLITSIDKNNMAEKYVLYNINKQTKTEIDNQNLKRDGHPVFESQNVFYSDTYPNRRNMQTVFKYDLKNDIYENILNIYSDFRLVGEKRCDLHPKYIKEKNIILIDSTFSGKKRSVISIELEDDINEK